MVIKCDLCNKEFKYKVDLERHKNRKTTCNKSNELYNCDICKSDFNSKSHLESHEKTHY